jgi:hypothetical protein
VRSGPARCMAPAGGRKVSGTRCAVGLRDVWLRQVAGRYPELGGHNDDITPWVQDKVTSFCTVTITVLLLSSWLIPPDDVFVAGDE